MTIGSGAKNSGRVLHALLQRQFHIHIHKHRSIIQQSTAINTCISTGSESFIALLRSSDHNVRNFSNWNDSNFKRSTNNFYSLLCQAFSSPILWPTNTMNGSIRMFGRKGGSGGYKKRNMGKGGNKDDNKSGAILNDDLRRILIRKKVTSIRVRLELHDGGNNAPEVMTVDEAIDLAEEYQLDIVSVALNAEIPVVKIENHNKALFLAKKIAKEKNKMKPKSLPVKEIKFKAGIDENDLQRKIDNVIVYLEKGHNCQITVMSAFRRAKANDKIVDETYERVYKRLEDFVKDPQLAGRRQNWRHKSVTLRPIDNLSKVLEDRE